MASRSPIKVAVCNSNFIVVCRCCNENVFAKSHPIDLYGKKAMDENLVGHIQKLTGTKLDKNDGLSTKICRSCYSKIDKFKLFVEKFHKSTTQQQSVVRFKRKKSLTDSPSLSPSVASIARVKKRGKLGFANSHSVTAFGRTSLALNRTLFAKPDLCIQEQNDVSNAPSCKVRVLPFITANAIEGQEKSSCISFKNVFNSFKVWHSQPSSKS